MPLGFTPGTLLGIQRHYGDQLLAGIEKGGQIIEQGLKQITTKRQLEGLGQTLSQISPESPDYPQQLIKVGSEFPFAMQDPRGQAMMSIGVQAHNQWQQQQKAIQQSELAFGRQKEMETVRHQNRLGEIAARPRAADGGEMDLSGILSDGLPRRDGPMQPPSRGAMIATPQEGIPLFGQRDGLKDIARSALRPLAEAQEITGVKPTPKQGFSAVAGEITRRNQQQMQDDRQAEAAKKAAEQAAEKNADEARKEGITAKEKEFTNTKDILQSRANRLAQRLGKERDILVKIKRDPVDKEDRNLDFDKQHMEQTAKVQQIEKELAEAEAELAKLIEGKTQKLRYEGGKFVPK